MADYNFSVLGLTSTSYSGVSTNIQYGIQSTTVNDPTVSNGTVSIGNEISTNLNVYNSINSTLSSYDNRPSVGQVYPRIYSSQLQFQSGVINIGIGTTSGSISLSKRTRNSRLIGLRKTNGQLYPTGLRQYESQW